MILRIVILSMIFGSLSGAAYSSASAQPANHVASMSTSGPDYFYCWVARPDNRALYFSEVFPGNFEDITQMSRDFKAWVNQQYGVTASVGTCRQGSTEEDITAKMEEHKERQNRIRNNENIETGWSWSR